MHAVVYPVVYRPIFLFFSLPFPFMQGLDKYSCCCICELFLLLRGRRYRCVTLFYVIPSAHLTTSYRIGAAGKSGDSAILRDSWLMGEITKNPELWLGKDGVIAADGGKFLQLCVNVNAECIDFLFKGPQTAEIFSYNPSHSQVRSTTYGV